MDQRLLFILAVATSSAGCFAPKLAAQQRAANEFQCPLEQVAIEDLSGNAYRTRACGYQTIYVCSPRLEFCLKEGTSTRIATQPVAAQPTAAAAGWQRPAATAPQPTRTTPPTWQR